MLRWSSSIPTIDIRCSVLAAQGKAFCAGAQFQRSGAAREQESRTQTDPASNLPINHLYVQAVRIFRNKKPIVAAVHGGCHRRRSSGLRYRRISAFTCPEGALRGQLYKTRFPSGLWIDDDAARADRQRTMAELMFYTSRRVTGEEAYRWGLANVLVPQGRGPAAAAMKLAQEIAECSPARPWSRPAPPLRRRPRRPRARRHQFTKLVEQDQTSRHRGFQGRASKATTERRAREFQGR